MSQHIFIAGSYTQNPEEWEGIKWVFGWDHPLQSFYLQKHDGLVEDEDANPVLWLGATFDTKMYEVEDLVRVAKKHGLIIDQTTQSKLYLEKDDGV